jgi:AraC family transcriptional regulator
MRDRSNTHEFYGQREFAQSHVANVASLIENAVAYFEVDPAASRSHLLRAIDLVKAKVPISQTPTRGSRRGTLAAWQTRRVIAYIEANLSKELNGNELAAVAKLSPSHFFRAFKVSVGVPPHEYVTRRRVQLAQAIMTSTATPLAQVALECGFNDQSSLCRIFRRLTGQSPNAWRRANFAGPESINSEHRERSVGNSSLSPVEMRA